MKELLANIFSAQNAQPGTRDGLPYWIFWLLLCIILLLSAFIFLRDKDFRQRLNRFLFGAKQKLIKIKRQHQLKKEIKKKSTALKNLGQKAWNEKILVPNGEHITHDIKDLSEKIEEQKEEEKNITAKIDSLQDDLDKSNIKYQEMIAKEETKKAPFQNKIDKSTEHKHQIEQQITEKQKQVQDPGPNELKKPDEDKILEDLTKDKIKLDEDVQKFQASIDDLEAKIKTLNTEKKQHSREYQKEIKEWEKSREKTQEDIRAFDNEKEPLFMSLGETLETERIQHKELDIFYSQLDRNNQRIKELEEQIDQLD